VPVRVIVTIRGERALFDFTGTGAAVAGPINATRFIAASAVYYSLKALVAPDVPANDGCYRPIDVHVPAGTILNPPPDAPVVGGNHETPSARSTRASRRSRRRSRSGSPRAGRPPPGSFSSARGRRAGGASSTRCTGAVKARAPAGTAGTPFGSTCRT
jgi:N-methylhydantoinase B